MHCLLLEIFPRPWRMDFWCLQSRLDTCEDGGSFVDVKSAFNEFFLEVVGSWARGILIAFLGGLKDLPRQFLGLVISEDRGSLGEFERRVVPCRPSGVLPLPGVKSLGFLVRNRGDGRLGDQNRLGRTLLDPHFDFLVHRPQLLLQLRLEHLRSLLLSDLCTETLLTHR
jgi:hypothetical protein